MDHSSLLSDISTHLPDVNIKTNHPLAPTTTLKIGGPADVYLHSTSNHSFRHLLAVLNQNSIIPTILGNGSNVLIADSGIRGIVIKNSSQSIEIINTSPIPVKFHHSYTQRNENEPEKYLDFTKLDYDESKEPQVLVKISSGTSLPYAINHLIDHGITGLQWFAYIPGTTGGATWYNIHGGAYHFADYLDSVEVYNPQSGKIETYRKNQDDWSYENSFFLNNPSLVILSTTLRLFKGNTQLATQVKNAWIAQKTKVQPMNSAGSIFQNPPLALCQKVWGEQKSTGWIIDHELGLKGHQIGGAQISLQHANFIVNTGSATATDYLSLVRFIQSQARSKLGIDLETEIKLLGQFD